METTFDASVDPALVARALEPAREGSVWLDMPATRHARLTAQLRADLVVVGGGYLGLWTALKAVEREPGTKVVLVEAHRLGWAASGRNGGFCDASLTHGRANGEARWPDEMDELERLGMENLDGMGADVERLGLAVEWERTGSLTVATEPHQVDWLRTEAIEDRGVFLSAEQTRAELDSPTFLAGYLDRDGTALVHPGRLVQELARACLERGVEIFERSKATAIDSDDEGVTVHTSAGSVRAPRAMLATNAFPSLLRRDRLSTVPVYDYVLTTEPLTAEQKAAIGWGGRRGISDAANQFHYYRLTADDRIVWGGYDAVYFYGGRIRPEHERRQASFDRLAAHFLTTFPQLEDVRFAYRWAGVIDTSTRFCAQYGLARGGKVAYANGFTGLGVAATRFAADVSLDRLTGLDTERTQLQMVRQPALPFPPEPFASAGIQATRWSLDRADHSRGRRNALLQTLDALGLGFDS